MGIRYRSYLSCVPEQGLIFSFEKLDGYFAIMGDDRPCKVEGIGTVRIKMFDGIVRELKKVRYVSQVKKNLISVGTLEALGHGVSIRDGVLKMTRGSMVVLKGVRRNNLYYLMGSTVTGRVATSISSGDVCTQVTDTKLELEDVYFEINEIMCANDPSILLL